MQLPVLWDESAPRWYVCSSGMLRREGFEFGLSARNIHTQIRTNNMISLRRSTVNDARVTFFCWSTIFLLLNYLLVRVDVNYSYGEINIPCICSQGMEYCRMMTCLEVVPFAPVLLVYPYYYRRFVI